MFRNVYMLSDTTVDARVFLCGGVGNSAVCKQWQTDVWWGYDCRSL